MSKQMLDFFGKFFSHYSKVPDRTVFLLTSVICLTCLVFALTAEVVFKIMPCSLCIYERYVYVAILLISIAGIVKSPPLLTQWLCTLAALFGCGLTIYHIGVELHWWQGLAACKAPQGIKAQSMEEMRRAIESEPFVPCDEIGWRIFGIPATWINLLIMLSLAKLSGFKIWLRRK